MDELKIIQPNFKSNVTCYGIDHFDTVCTCCQYFKTCECPSDIQMFNLNLTDPNFQKQFFSLLLTYLVVHILDELVQVFEPFMCIFPVKITTHCKHYLIGCVKLCLKITEIRSLSLNLTYSNSKQHGCIYICQINCNTMCLTLTMLTHVLQVIEDFFKGIIFDIQWRILGNNSKFKVTYLKLCPECKV